VAQSRQLENSVNQPLVSRAASPTITADDPTPRPRSSRSANIRAIPSETRAVHLIKLFFSDTGTMFPYMHEQAILDSYYNAKEHRFAAVSRSWLCLLNVIFAFATYITAHPEQSTEKNAAESEVFIDRAQALSSEIQMKHATIETGKHMYLDCVKWED
jgi:hypothetical protein